MYWMFVIVVELDGRQSRTSDGSGNYILCGGWGPIFVAIKNGEFISCQGCGARKFEVADRFWEN